jgi:hypothetical protein
VVKDGDFIAVAATDIKTATTALLSINAKWEEKNDQPSNANIFDYLVKNSSKENAGRNSATTTADVEKV